MKSVVIKRLLSSLVVIFVLTIVVFLIVHLLPGDPVTIMLGEYASEDQVNEIKEMYGLDKPLVSQYFFWLKNFVKLDWGESITTHEPVFGLIMERLPRTFVLCIFSVLLAILIATPLGVISAAKHNSVFDLGISGISLLFLSMPLFWLAILLLILFAIVLPILPAGGYQPISDFGGWIKSITLPVIALAMTFIPIAVRLIRSSMLEVLNEDYILLARTKGASEFRTNFIHALRNSLIPVSTMISIQISTLMAGAIIAEQVFQYPGMGFLLLGAIESRNYPLIQGCIFTFSIIIVLVNLLTDIAYAVIDPKIRYN